MFVSAAFSAARCDLLIDSKMRMEPFEYNFACSRTVRQRETDASGFVHFANYLCYMEETEYAFLRTRGLSVVLRDRRGVIGFPRTSAHFEVLAPLRAGSSIEIRLKLEVNDGVKVGYRFQISSGKEIAATGDYSVACCRFSAGKLPKAILVPDYVRERLSGGECTFSLLPRFEK